MKKVFSLVLMALFVSQLAIAAEYSVSPAVAVNFADEFKTAVSVGAKVNAEALPYLPKEVVVSSGLTYAQLETNDGSLQDTDLFTIPVEVGYKYAIDSKLSVKPYAGLDFILVNSHSVDNTVGGHLGTEFSYQIKENLSAELNAGWRFAETDVLGEKKSLNGGVLGGSVSYKF